jgi:opacity protein-like surface antigen
VNIFAKAKTATSITVLAAALATSASGARAADIFNNGGLKDEGSVSEGRPVNWTGFYIGGSVGYGNANHNLTLEQYHGAYCWDRDGTQDPVQPENTYDPWDGAFDGHAEALNADGSCGGDAVLGTPTGPYANGGTKPHGNGVGAPTNAWDEDDHASVAGKSREIANLDGLNSHGIVGDVRLGGDIQRGRFVFGVYGAYNFSGMETSGSIADLGGFDIEKGDEWLVAARAGLLVNPRTLAYVLAGYSQTEYEFSIHGDGERESKTVDFSGLVVGGGVEFALTQNIFLGIEGTHAFYGEETLLDSGVEEGDPTGNGVRLTDEIGETKVMGTLKIKLNSGLPNFVD